VQSYWGDLNDSYGVLAENILVLDNFAKEATLKRYKNCNVIIFGAFQSKRYDSIDIEQEREKFRKKHLENNNNQVKIIGLFGQPLFEYGWYKRTISTFLYQLTKVNLKFILAFKNHPKESEESIVWTIGEMEKLKINYFTVDEKDVLKVLTGTDVAVSLFSTIGYDLQNLLIRTNNAFSTSVYLFFDENLRSWYYEYSKLDKIPVLNNDSSVIIKDQQDIVSCLNRILHDPKILI